MNISKNELGKTLKKYKGARWDRALSSRKSMKRNTNAGGRTFGCLVGDYYFDHSPPDVELLGEMAKSAAAAHAPFIAGASPSVDADGFLGRSSRIPPIWRKKFRDAGVCRLAVPEGFGRFTLYRAGHAPLPGTLALRV